jgi:hypothetical protein
LPIAKGKPVAMGAMGTARLKRGVDWIQHTLSPWQEKLSQEPPDHLTGTHRKLTAFVWLIHCLNG